LLEREIWHLMHRSEIVASLREAKQEDLKETKMKLGRQSSTMWEGISRGGAKNEAGDQQ
jgi:hypothetical protein